MSLSLFDIIGPVMHGPSSNHTGGANRIGYLARNLMGGQPQNIILGFHPVYMNSYAGQRSHVALLAGCLGYREYDAVCNQSIRICAKKGIQWKAAPIAESDRSRNTMRITGEVDGNTFVINGDSIGGGAIRIDSINGLPIHLDGNSFVTVIFSENEKLVREKADRLAENAGDNVLERTEGRVLGENYLCCLVSRKPFEQLQALEEDKSVHIHVVKPLFEFCDSGNAPLFSTFAEFLAQAEGKDAAELAISYECNRCNVSREKVLGEAMRMAEIIGCSLEEAEKGIELIGQLTDPTDGRKLLDWARSGNAIVNDMFVTGLARAVLLAQMNGAGCRVVAAPTGGAAGCLPGVLFTVAERYHKDKEELAKAFLLAACVGMIIGNRASFSGTVGGCQSEVGIGAAMGAAGVAWLAGGDSRQIVQSCVIALKNVLGLTCDPPASPVEIPCIKRNAMGVSVALFAAEIGMAGISSAIDPDDVVDALADTQKRMPMELKFSHIGGLACTDSGKRLSCAWKERLKTLD